MALHALLVVRPGNPPLAKTSALNCSMVTRCLIGGAADQGECVGLGDVLACA